MVESMDNELYQQSNPLEMGIGRNPRLITLVHVQYKTSDHENHNE